MTVRLVTPAQIIYRDEGAYRVTVYKMLQANPGDILDFSHDYTLITCAGGMSPGNNLSISATITNNTQILIDSSFLTVNYLSYWAVSGVAA